MSVLFSVIIPARNAADTLDQCLESLKKMDYPADRYEVIVVDDRSTDDTAEVARRFGAKVLAGPGGSIPRVRNFGAAEARGKVIVHLDSDMVVDPRWLHRAEEYYGNGFEGALFFEDQSPADSHWIAQVWYGPSRNTRTRAQTVRHLPTRDLFVNRRIHQEVGGLDEKLFAGGRAASDKEYTYRIGRLGYPVVSDPTLTMIHLGCEKSFGEFLRKEFWRQGHTLLIARRHGYTLRLLKAPLFAALHLLLGLNFLVSMIVFPRAGYLTFTMWLLPSVLILISRTDLVSYWRLFLPALAATFTRWNVAGIGLFPQFWRLIKK